jgi:hypothetical protein
MAFESEKKPQGWADLPAAGRLRPVLKVFESVGGEGSVERIGIAAGIADGELLRAGC